jgi:hypothetical protein
MSAAPSFLITVVDSCASAKLALDALYLPYCPKGAVTFALGHLGSLARHQQSRSTFCPEPDPASQRCSHWQSQLIKSVVVTVSTTSLAVLFPSANQRQGWASSNVE